MTRTATRLARRNREKTRGIERIRERATDRLRDMLAETTRPMVKTKVHSSERTPGKVIKEGSGVMIAGCERREDYQRYIK